jgi:hypothetical protein
LNKCEARVDFDALERLVRLRDSGALTHGEFEEQKKALLGTYLPKSKIFYGPFFAKYYLYLTVGGLFLVLVVTTVVVSMPSEYENCMAEASRYGNLCRSRTGYYRDIPAPHGESVSQRTIREFEEMSRGMNAIMGCYEETKRRERQCESHKR